MIGFGLHLSINMTHIRTVLQLGCGRVISRNTGSVVLGFSKSYQIKPMKKMFDRFLHACY